MWGLAPVTAREEWHQDTGHSPWSGPGPSGYLPPRLRALQPGLGLECCAWGKEPLGSPAHPSQQAG